MRESIPHNTDLLLVGLNISKRSSNNDILWSSQRGPWNIWTKAGIFKSYPSDLKLAVKNCNKAPYSNGLMIGFTDMVDVTETNSSRVSINKQDPYKLTGKLVKYQVRNVALMGDKVIQKFVEVHPELRDLWKTMKENLVICGNGRKIPNYGFLGSILIHKTSISVYAMPFPTTVPIPNKYLFYEGMVTNIKISAKERKLITGE